MCFLGKIFLLQFQFPCLWLDCSYFLFLLASTFGRLYFSKYLLISSRLSILLAYFLILLFYDPLNLCVICCNFFFVYNFIDLSLLFFFFFPFPWWVWLMICQFYPFKEPTFCFNDLCYCFLCFFFIYFYTDLYDLFPSITFGFFCSSFSSCLRCNISLFICHFSCFFR